MAGKLKCDMKGMGDYNFRGNRDSTGVQLTNAEIIGVECVNRLCCKNVVFT